MGISFSNNYIFSWLQKLTMSGRALIYGGRGGLGSVLVSHFKQKGWWICSVDILEGNEEADVNVIVDPNIDWHSQEQHVVSSVEKHLPNEQKLDSIINMAGNFIFRRS